MKQNIAGARRQDGRHQTNQPLKAVRLPSPGCSPTPTLPRPFVPAIVSATAPASPGTTPPSVRRYSGWSKMQISSVIKNIAYIQKKTCNLCFIGIKCLCFGVLAQLVRASACHAEGRGFEPLTSRHNLFRRQGGSLKFWPHRLMVRTPPFQGENPGSNPSGAAKIKRPPKRWSFILAAPLGFEPGFSP